MWPLQWWHLEFDGMFGAQRFWRKASGKSRVSHALKPMFLASDLIINMLPKIGQNSIWVSRINYESADSLDVFGESQNQPQVTFLGPTLTRLPVSNWCFGSIETQTLQRYFATSWGMFLCVLLVWAMERPACGTSRECWCQTLAFARSFMKFSKSCLKTVHGWSHTWVFRGFGDSWFLLYLWGKSIVADELWLQLCSSLKTRSSYPEWCLRMRTW